MGRSPSSRSMTTSTKPPHRQKILFSASPQSQPPISAKKKAVPTLLRIREKPICNVKNAASESTAKAFREEADLSSASGAALSPDEASPQAVKGIGWADERGVRPEMEDAAQFVDKYAGSPSSAYFAVYDGHGGTACVQYVVDNLHQILANEIYIKISAIRASQGTNPDHGEGCCVSTRKFVPHALKRAFERVDEAMLRDGILQSGCTACSCVLTEGMGGGNCNRTLHVAHVGDTRAVLAHRVAHVTEAQRLTSESDHKATDPGEMERIQKAGGSVIRDRVNGILAISRALGDFELKKPAQPKNVVSNVPDVVSVDITDDDEFVIVACDGLWDVMSDQEAVNFIIDARQSLAPWNLGSRGLSHEADILAQYLVDAALTLGSQDNVSCLVVFL